MKLLSIKKFCLSVNIMIKNLKFYKIMEMLRGESWLIYLIMIEYY